MHVAMLSAPTSNSSRVLLLCLRKSRSRSRSRSGDQKQGRRQPTSPPPAFSSPQTHSYTHRQTRPESPGSYVARMQQILAQVHQTTRSDTGSASRSPGDNNAARKAFERHHGAAPPSPVMGGAVVGTGAVASCDAVREPAAAPLEGSGIQRCWERGDDGKTERRSQAGGTEEQGPYDLAVAGRTEVEKEEGQEEGLVYFEEPESRRNLELMIAAVSAMVGMMVPESYQWVLWLACSLVTVWFPLRNRLSFSFALWWPLSGPSSAGFEAEAEAAKMVDLDADLGTPPPYVDVGVDVHVSVGVGVEVGGDVDVVGVHASPVGDVVGRTEIRSRHHAADKVDSNDSGQAGEGGIGGSLSGFSDKNLGGREAKVRTVGLIKAQEEQYGEVMAGLSEAELEFVKSAGDEEETRLLRQVSFVVLWLLCLVYAARSS